MVFRFGIPRCISNIRTCSPAGIRSKPLIINSSQIKENEDLPLLASQPFMDVTRTLLDVHGKVCHMIALEAFDIPMFRAPSGHLCIEISEFPAMFPDEAHLWPGDYRTED